ncbi:ECF transporter S component [Streptococcaceae bacterium ESL0729]|nr:ECF transporter S component [Streptococcaceae bacterium ESL0729]
MSTKKISQLALLSALAIISRFALVQFPNFKMVSAIFFVTVVFWGLADGIIVMILTMTLSGIYLGMNVVVLFQIIAFALILILWKFLYKFLPNTFLKLMVVGLLTFLYGFIMSLFTTSIFAINFWAYYLNGFWFDVNHAISTIIFYPLIYNIFERLKL